MERFPAPHTVRMSPFSLAKNNFPCGNAVDASEAGLRRHWIKPRACTGFPKPHRQDASIVIAQRRCSVKRKFRSIVSDGLSVGSGKRYTRPLYFADGFEPRLEAIVARTHPFSKFEVTHVLLWCLLLLRRHLHGASLHMFSLWQIKH
jgi:hypothetical protein